VDADLKADVGTIVQGKLLTLVAQRVADGRGLTRLARRLTAGDMPHGRRCAPWLRHLLLTPFDRERRQRGYQLRRSADDWVSTAGRPGHAAATAHGACAPGLRLPGLEEQARQSRAVPAGGADQHRGASRGALGRAAADVGGAVSGGDSPADAASPPASDRGADPRAQSRDSRGGRGVHARSRAEALPPPGSVGGTAAVITPPPAVALCGGEHLPDMAAARPVGAGQPDRAEACPTPAATGRAFVNAAGGRTARAL
jgi:hypothetical protein